jgi:hypothetical protein
VTSTGFETQFTLHNAWSERTDIDISPPSPVNMFRQTHRRTDLSEAGLANDKIRRAVSWFDTTFTPDRDATLVLFFSLADAITCNFRIQESFYAALTRFAALPAEAGTEAYSLPDPATVPRQLTEWLGLTYDQLAAITRLSRATFFYWRRPGIQPRPDNVRRLEQLYAATSLLVRRLGVRGARAWLQSGSGSAWEQLVSGDLAGLESRVRASMFTTRSVAGPINRLLLDEVSPILPPAPNDPEHAPHRARRPPKRGRLGDA